jgi:hypothetical protein
MFQKQESTFQGEVRTKLGLEGNGKNPFYRIDATMGGHLVKMAHGPIKLVVSGFRMGQDTQVMQVTTVDN